MKFLLSRKHFDFYASEQFLLFSDFFKIFEILITEWSIGIWGLCVVNLRTGPEYTDCCHNPNDWICLTSGLQTSCLFSQTEA